MDTMNVPICDITKTILMILSEFEDFNKINPDFMK